MRETLLTACFSTPALMLLGALCLPNGKLRRLLGPGLSVCLLAGTLCQAGSLNSLERLMICSLWLLSCLKGWSLMKLPRDEVRASSPVGLLLFAYLWPGVDPKPFRQRGESDTAPARWFVFGFPTTALGVGALFILALKSQQLPASILGLAGAGAVLTAIHLGFCDVLSSLVRLLGFPVTRLFHHPLMSRSLQEFWSLRWNRPFVEMNKLLFRPLLKRRFSPATTIVLLFVISGLLHEMAISFTSGGGWGGPIAYFALQGSLVLVERRHKIRDWPGLLARLWTWFWLLAPAPILFHQAFREEFILRLLTTLHNLPPLSSDQAFLTTLLTLAGWGHFLVLVASFQVPSRLGWKEELARLRPLNRKLLWTYGGYIVGNITTWGILTLQLRSEMMAGERSAIAILIVIAIFWWSRIVVDAFYFEHSDWPEGVEFVLGHTMLTTLFVCIASTYTTLLVWHFW